MIYFRIKPEGSFIKEEDYVHGFGIDSTHYNCVHQARIEHNEKVRNTQLITGIELLSTSNNNILPVNDDFQEDYDSREGFSISGKPLNTRPHPYHKLELLEKKTGKIYVVDSVHKQHYFGYYIVLMARPKNGESHATLIWENISCKNPLTLINLKSAHRRFEVINK